LKSIKGSLWCKEASEEKRCWRQEVMKIIRSWHHQKYSHQKLDTRSWRNQRFWRSSEAERLEASKFCHMLLLSYLYTQKEWKPRATVISEEFEGIGCLSTEQRRKKDNSTIVQPLSPLLYFVSAIVQEQQMWLRWYSSILGMNLKLFLQRTITKSSNKSLVIWSSFYNDSNLMCWQICNVSFTPCARGFRVSIH